MMGCPPLAPAPRRMTPREQELAATAVSLARALARSWGRRCPDLREEFESRALLSVCKAAMKFDEARGVKFKTYAFAFIIRAIYRHLHSPEGRRRRRWVRLGKYAVRYYEATEILEEARDRRDWVAVGMGRLSPRSRCLLRLLYRCHQTARAVGRRQGLSIQTISRRHHAALRALRSHLDNCA